MPKRSPNPPKIQSKTPPNLMLSCERRKVNPSKHSHTFPHFCSFQTRPNRLEFDQKTEQNSDLSWTASWMPQKTRSLTFLADFWLPTWSQVRSILAQKPATMSCYVGPASTMGGQTTSEPKNPPKMKPISVRNGSKFRSKRLHIPLSC